MAKKITAIVSLSIIGILIIATIIMANINVNHGIDCASPDFIRVQYSSLNAVVTVKDEEKAKIEKLINSASNDNALKSMFSGVLFSKAKVKTISDSSRSIPSSNDFYVQYVYNTRQTLKEGGKEVKDDGGNKYYFKELWFSVNSGETATENVIVYVVPWLEGQNTVKQYTKYYEFKLDLSSLYTYLSSLSYFSN